MIKRMCSNVGISERFTNHSLHAYEATTLFQAEVPEKLVQQRTGHRSVEGVRRYERTSESQLLDISNIMSCGGKVPSNSALSATKKQMPIATRKLPYDDQPCMAMPSAKKSDNVIFVLNNCNFQAVLLLCLIRVQVDRLKSLLMKSGFVQKHLWISMLMTFKKTKSCDFLGHYFKT